MCGDDFAFGEPSSLCSLKLARRPSTLPLPFLWANLTPLRPFPIVKKGRAGSLESCLLCCGLWGSRGSGGRGGSRARRRRGGRGGGDGEACDNCLTSDHVWRGSVSFWARAGRTGLAGRGWRVDACWARGGLTVVGGSDAGGEGGRNVETRGTAAQCSWSYRSDGVEFYMYQPLGSTHLGCLAGWSLQIAPSATSVRQRSSVRSCRGAALGRLAPRGLKDAVVLLGGGPSVSRFWSSTWVCLITSSPSPSAAGCLATCPPVTILSLVWSLVSRGGAWSV